MREVTSTDNNVTYLQGDSLGSVSLSTNGSGVTVTSQEFDPLGKVSSGGVTATDWNYTSQYLDDTGPRSIMPAITTPRSGALSQRIRSFLVIPAAAWMALQSNR